MSKIRKVKRRAFTEKQLDMLEQYHLLYKRMWGIGITDEEDEYFDYLKRKIEKFLSI